MSTFTETIMLVGQLVVLDIASFESSQAFVVNTCCHNLSLSHSTILYHKLNTSTSTSNLADTGPPSCGRAIHEWTISLSS